ncbi:phage minor capsid protein [Nocardiopsis rhodophaea]
MPGVDPADIEEIVAQVSAIYREAELAVYRQISRHLIRYPGAPTAGVGEPRLEAIGDLRRSVEAIQAGLEADGSRALREAVARAWQVGDRSALADIPARWYAASGIGDAAEEARTQVPQSGAIEALATALVADVGARVRNVLRDALDAYRSAVAGATARMLAGGQTRREAAQAAWAALVDRGVLGFTDRAGRRWRLHTYVEMAARTASARAAVQGQDDRLGALGVDLVYVSDHGQECPLCRPWEGKILHRVSGPTGEIRVPHALTDEPMTVEVAGTLAEARGKGLFHPNCRHSISAYLPGVTTIPTPVAEPAAYEARMRQREIERKIRRWKEQATAATTDEARTAARRRVRAWHAEMRQHLANHPELKRLRYREQVGAGSTPPDDRRDDTVAPIGPDVQPSLDGTGAEAVRRTSVRDEEPAAGADERTPAAGQPELTELTRTELRALSDDELDARMGAVIATGDYESATARQLRREMDRRDQVARQRERRRREREARDQARHAAMAELVESGVPWEEAAAEVLGTPVEAIRRREFTREHRAGESDRRSFTQLAREQYRLFIERTYVAAETETRGFLLNAAGEAAGIDPMSLFSGPRARVERYASEELKRWFDEHGRTMFAQFVEEIEQGRRTGAPGRDFNR